MLSLGRLLTLLPAFLALDYATAQTDNVYNDDAGLVSHRYILEFDNSASFQQMSKRDGSVSL